MCGAVVSWRSRHYQAKGNGRGPRATRATDFCNRIRRAAKWISHRANEGCRHCHQGPALPSTSNLHVNPIRRHRLQAIALSHIWVPMPMLAPSMPAGQALLSFPVGVRCHELNHHCYKRITTLPPQGFDGPNLNLWCPFPSHYKTILHFLSPSQTHKGGPIGSSLLVFIHRQFLN